MELLMNCLFAPLSEATTKPMQYRCADNASREEASALIQAAALALQDAMAAVREQTGSHALSTATTAGTEITRSEMDAIELCMTSVGGLLEITNALVRPTSVAPTPLERALSWKQLAEDAKGAGRAAYRAVLILTDPSANAPDAQRRSDARFAH
jgi:FAD/FMN-containing dehydrogenase